MVTKLVIHLHKFAHCLQIGLRYYRLIPPEAPKKYNTGQARRNLPYVLAPPPFSSLLTLILLERLWM